MDLHAQTVSEAVAKIFAVTRIRDDLSGGLMNHFAKNSRLGSIHSRLLGLEYRMIHLVHLFRHIPYRHSTGHV